MPITVPSDLATGEIITETWVDSARQGIIDLRDRVVELCIAPHRRDLDDTVATSYATAGMNTAGHRAWYFFSVPAEFAALVSVRLVVFAQSTGTAQVDFTATYATSGEAYNTHQVTLSNQTLDITNGNMHFWTLPSALWANLAAGDVVGVRVYSAGTKSFAVGPLIVRYTLA